MTTYRTGNPIGSTAVQDLYDNAENLDVLVNDRTQREHEDRLGAPRKTWYGMEQDFQDFLISSGYQNIGDYGAGLEITARNQIFWKDGELYRAGASLELPYTTSGVWEDEEELFVPIGDAALRQQLADSTGPGNGAGMVAFIQRGLGAVPTSVLEKLRETVSVLDFGAKGNGIADDTLAIQAAINSLPDGGVIHIPPGRYLVSSSITVAAHNITLQGQGRDSTTLDFSACLDDYCIEVVDAKNQLSLYDFSMDGVQNSGVFLNDSDHSNLENIFMLRPAGTHTATGNDAGEGYMREGVEMRLYRPSRESTVAVDISESNTCYLKNVMVEGFHKGVYLRGWCHNTTLYTFYARSCNYGVHITQYSDQVRIDNSYAALCFCFGWIQGTRGGAINACYSERGNVPLIINRDGAQGNQLTVTGFYTVPDVPADVRWFEVTNSATFPGVVFVNCTWLLPMKVSNDATISPIRFVGPAPEIIDGEIALATRALFSDTPVAIYSKSFWEQSPDQRRPIESTSDSTPTKIDEFGLVLPSGINDQQLRIFFETNGSNASYPVYVRAKVYRRAHNLDESRNLRQTTVWHPIQNVYKTAYIDINISALDEDARYYRGQNFIVEIEAYSGVSANTVGVVSYQASLLNV